MPRIILACLLLLPIGLTALPLYAQQADTSRQDAKSTGDGEAERTIELPAQLNTLEAVRKLVAGDPNDQFQMLPRISPRGVDEPTRAQMIEQLLPLLQSEHPDIRGRTAKAISLFGEPSQVAIPELLNLLGDTDHDVQYKTVWSIASRALAQIGTASIQPAMAKMPTAQGTEFLGITAIVSELGDEPEARATAPFFLDHLKNGPKHHRWASMYCLSKLGDVAAPAIPEYIQHLDDPNFNIQVIACRALAAQGLRSKAAIPKLVQLVKKEKANMLSTRTHAAMCLGAIGPVHDDVDLVKLLKDMIAEPNAFCQERGLIALGRLGRHAEEAAPFVNRMLDKESFSQRPEAALALWKITGNPARSIELLRPMITDLTYEFRALEAIKAIGRPAAPLAKEVAQRLETDDASLQLMVAEVLIAIGSGREYLDQLRPLADQAPPDIAIRLDAILAKLNDELNDELDGQLDASN